LKTPVKISIVQAGPVYLDLKKSIEKASDLIEKAMVEKPQLIVFGECWFSGYPIWLDCCPNVNLWDHDPVKEVWAQTFQNSLELGSEDLIALQQLAKIHKVNLILGANEKISSGPGNSTIYNSVFTIDHLGRIRNHHRKLMPTHTERLVHGLGDGNGLTAVDLDIGRVGSLICWEHWMPMARQAMHDSAEDIHLALWPQVKPLNRVASQHYAVEGRCFVIAAGQVMYASELPDQLENPYQTSPNTLIMNGGSCIYGPDGSELLNPQGSDMEIVHFEFPSGADLIKERMNLAVSGHYQRDDIFDFAVNKERPF
jgi:predicted amidohydrolase